MSRRPALPDRALIGPDTPLRLAVAAAAFGLTASACRAEALETDLD